MDSRQRLLRPLVLLILVAAVLSAPIFLFAEGFEQDNLPRILLSNGVCAVFCVALLALLRRGRVELSARLFVFGLMAIVGILAWSNGEDVHVNVVNFVLVSVLAGTLLERRWLALVALVSAALMIGIAWKQVVSAPAGEELFEARLEAIVQFLPTYLVIVAVLALRGPASSGE
jgi:hypothetical protein